MGICHNYQRASYVNIHKSPAIDSNREGSTTVVGCGDMKCRTKPRDGYENVSNHLIATVARHSCAAPVVTYPPEGKEDSVYVVKEGVVSPLLPASS